MDKKETATLLEEAADDLENLELPPNAKFDMGTWGEHPYGPKPDLENLCSTTACAAGWLSLMPKWRNRGFTSHWLQRRTGIDTVGPWGLIPIEGQGWEAMGAQVFGATSHELACIFFATGDSRDEVVERFRELAVEYWKDD